MREHGRVVALAARLGTVRCDAVRAFVWLDAHARLHFELPEQDDSALPLDAWIALIAPEDRLRVHALLHSSHSPDSTESVTVQVPISRSQRRVLDLSFRVAPAGGLVGACRDVTREHSIETVRSQKLAADRANQAKSEFMSQVSHELRTPLNAILGFAELMMLDRGDPLPPVEQDRLQVLHQSGQRLLGLIDQLLQISRIEQGKVVLRRRSVHALGLVHRCVAAMQVLAAQRGIEIEIDTLDATGGISVRSDPDALEQVVINLLSNAIKYNRDGGRVRVRLRGGVDCEITVDDTGVGLSDSQLACSSPSTGSRPARRAFRAPAWDW